MILFAYYIAKVALCSGVLLGYYWLALRNKTFHQWNRFYLLVCVVLSLTVPLLKINIGSDYSGSSSKVFRLLHVVTADDVVEVNSTGRAAFSLTAEQYGLIAYGSVSLLLLFIAARAAARIFTILRVYPKLRIEGLYFLNTNAEGTPFSFFNYIVWNQAINLDSAASRQIFQHELAHVRQRHSWDKVFLIFILIPFWSNPFFWIIRKELSALHEFTADQKAMTTHNAAGLAQLILNTAFPQQSHLFTSHLFQSTIKRRLAMFTKLQNPTVSYVSRIVALPLLVLVIAAFALKTTPAAKRSSLPLEKPLTVVIDAGHGALADGARQGTIYESDLALAIAKKIKAQNTNVNIRIIMTREDNQTPELKSRVQLASDNKADLFISIHLNTAGTTIKRSQQTGYSESGMEVIVSAKNPPYQPQSETLGSVLVQELASVYNTKSDLIKLKTGIWIIDHNVCPSVLIECGYLTDKNDLAFITQEKNQVLIANKILDAVERYAVLKNTGSVQPAQDTVPERMYKNKAVTDVQYFEWPKKEVHLFFTDGTKDTISYAEAKAANLFDTSAISRIERKPWIKNEANLQLMEGDFFMRKASIEEARNFTGIIVLNDKRFNGTFQQLPVMQNEIAHIAFIKGNPYEEFKIEPGDSVLDVSTKEYINANQRSDNEPLFTEPEIEAKFPDANGGWASFLKKNLNQTVAVEHNAPNGTYKAVVGFIVDKNGKLHDIKPLTTNGYGMEDEVVRILKQSPDWIPAKQNGHNVAAYKKQTVTFVIKTAS